MADTRWPFHGEVIADVAAHQWWMGPNPEALRKENVELFNINSLPLSSNMIALICSVVSSSSLGLYTFKFLLTPRADCGCP